MTTKLKLTLHGESHLLVPPKKFEELVAKIKDLFNEHLPTPYEIVHQSASGTHVILSDQTAYNSLLSLKQDCAKLVIRLPVPAGSPHPKDNANEFELVDRPDDSAVVQRADTKDKAAEERFVPIEESESEEAKDPKDAYSCPFCKGAKVTSQGTECGDCRGSGKMRPELVERVKVLVQDEVRAAIGFAPDLSPLQNRALRAWRVAEVARQGQPEGSHPGLRCLACGVQPIVGTAYTCPTCMDFAWCNECESFSNHEHPLLKVRNSAQAANAAALARLQSPGGKGNKDQAVPSFFARCIEDDLPDGRVFAPGKKLAKTWTLVNTGETKWPKDTVLVQDSGDRLEAAIVKVGEVAIRIRTQVRLVLTTPTKPGRYVAFFRLAYEGGKTFGQQLWIDIVVKGALQPQPQPQPQSQSHPQLKPQPLAVMESTIEERRLVEVVKKMSLSGFDLATFLVTHSFLEFIIVLLLRVSIVPSSYLPSC